MRVLELFSGSGIMSQTFRKHGHKAFTLDNNPDCKADMKIDIRDFKPSLKYDIIWASPPCTTFSVASIGTHWKGNYEPKTEACKEGLAILNETIRIITGCNCKYWYIENPRGVMRKVIDKIFAFHGIKTLYTDSVFRHTVTYCQYGDKRMKPTDIWTNNPNWKPRPMCKNGDKCHDAAPRGSKTGTQGLKDSFERGKLPKELCEEIVRASER